MAGSPRSPATAAGTWPPGRREAPATMAAGQRRGRVELGGLVNADANHVGGGSGHGGAIREGAI